MSLAAHFGKEEFYEIIDGEEWFKSTYQTSAGKLFCDEEGTLRLYPAENISIVLAEDVGRFTVLPDQTVIYDGLYSPERFCVIGLKGNYLYGGDITPDGALLYRDGNMLLRKEKTGQLSAVLTNIPDGASTEYLADCDRICLTLGYSPYHYLEYNSIGDFIGEHIGQS